MLKQSTIDEIRRKISDVRTQNVSVYDPQGIESLNEYEYPLSSVKVLYLQAQFGYITCGSGRSYRPGDLPRHNH